MDFFTSSGGTDTLSLHDMIECDIKSQLEEQIGGCDPMVGQGMGSLATTLSDNGLSVVTSTDLGSHICASDLDLDFGMGCGKEISWVLQPENSDPNLLVNPQTVLPMPSTTCSQEQASRGPLTVTLAHLSPVTLGGVTTLGLQQASPAQVQFVTTTIAGQTVLTQAQTQSPLHSIQSKSSNPSVATAIARSSNKYQRPLELTAQLLNTNNNIQKHKDKLKTDGVEKSYPKPVYSYSCLIAMALKNSDTGALPVSEIYNFMTENFPYFKIAPDGWKNSVRHNLSLNKCFEKIENPKANGNTRKGCLWGLNPIKIEKMDEEIAKWRKKDPAAIKRSMAKPEVLEQLEKGNLGSMSPRHPNNILSSHSQLLAQQMTHDHFPEHHDQLVNYEEQADHINANINTTANITVFPAHSIASASRHGISKSNNEVQLNLIEIKPADNLTRAPAIVTVKMENRGGECAMGIRSEDGASAMSPNISGEDFNILDNSLPLDPSLTDLALQNVLMEELGAEGINLDDIPLSSLTHSFSASSSPLTVQASGMSAHAGHSPLVSLLTANVNGAAAAGHPVSTSAGLALSRTIFAQT